MRDVFTSSDGSPRVVRGTAVVSGSARLAELAIRIGFDTVWIDLEHGSADLVAAEAMCHAIEAAGGFGTIRVPDGQRTSVLRALEAGARIVVVPMVNTAEQARAVVEFGKFPPVGQRGYNTRSRGLDYGLTPVPELFQQANVRTHLIVQIETTLAVSNVPEICRTPGLSGILIGPGDLSASLRAPGDFKNPQLIRAVTQCIQTARAAGLNAGILVGFGPLLDAALKAGCNLVFTGGDIANLIEPWRQILAALPTREGAA